MEKELGMQGLDFHAYKGEALGDYGDDRTLLVSPSPAFRRSAACCQRRGAGRCGQLAGEDLGRLGCYRG